MRFQGEGSSGATIDTTTVIRSTMSGISQRYPAWLPHTLKREAPLPCRAICSNIIFAG